MVGIRLERHQPALLQIIHNPLHVLPVPSQIPRKPRHRLRPLGCKNGTHDLPARARQPQARNEPVTGDSEQAVHPDQIENSRREGLSFGRALHA